MASIEMKMFGQLRPCMFDDSVKALFHCWEEVSQIVSPSMLTYGHSGGTVKETLAIIELEDGSVARVDKARIRFLDSDEKFHDEECSFVLYEEQKKRETDDR